MAKTYGERAREKAGELLQGDRVSGPDIDIPDKFFRSISQALPESMRPDGLERRSIRRDKARSSFRGILDELLDISIGQGLDDLEEQLREANEIDLDALDEMELMRFMANMELIQANASVASLENGLTSSVFLDDIASAVESPSTITINGINDTGRNPSDPSTVIPDTEGREFPATTMFMRASRENTDRIYFGDDDISPQSGFVLAPGESMVFTMDFRDDSLYMASDDRGQEVSYIGLL